MAESSHPRYRRLRAVAPSRLLLLIPAHDEAQSLGFILDRLATLPDRPPCLVVSDASRDRTAEVARQHGAKVLELPMQLGAWGATQAGLRFARRHGFDRVVTLDADGQHEPDCIAGMLAEQARSEADIVIGTHPQRMSRTRLLAWRWFRGISGLRIEDLTSGFRVYNRHAISLLASSEATLLEYQDVGVLLLARRYGLTIAEYPVTMHARHHGKSKVFASWLKVASYMLQTTVLCVSRIGTGGQRFIPR